MTTTTSKDKEDVCCKESLIKKEHGLSHKINHNQCYLMILSGKSQEQKPLCLPNKENNSFG